MEQLLTVVDMLRKGEILPPQYHNHLLHGDYKGYWECHINPDWLLLYIAWADALYSVDRCFI